MQRNAILALSMIVLLSGCAAGTTPQPTSLIGSAKISGPHDPIVLLGYSHMTSNGLRIAAKLDAGTYRFTDVSISIATADAGDPAPYTMSPEGKAMLAATSTEKGRFDPKEEEVEFTIGRGGLGKIGNKVVWYRWTIRFDRDGEIGTVQSPIYRTSRDEAGLPRAATAPGPDISVVPPAPVGAKRR
ncbi:MAG TPA: hypothetical protein VEC57_15505 [Candidatus Limnocylindrales bacterium]|nr:hypothetical protein [Candidatus Limnocylindrales bacterium]